METKLKSALIIVAVVLLISLTVPTKYDDSWTNTKRMTLLVLINQNLPTITVSEQGEVSVAHKHGGDIFCCNIYCRSC